MAVLATLQGYYIHRYYFRQKDMSISSFVSYN